MDTNIKATIKDKFNIKEIRDYQLNAIQSILNKKDCFVGQPTGSGKSLVYQALPIVHDIIYGTKTGSIILVVQPIIALMVNQLASLNAIGIPCIRLKHGKSIVLRGVGWFNTYCCCHGTRTSG